MNFKNLNMSSKIKKRSCEKLNHFLNPVSSRVDSMSNVCELHWSMQSSALLWMKAEVIERGSYIWKTKSVWAEDSIIYCWPRTTTNMRMMNIIGVNLYRRVGNHISSTEERFENIFGMVLSIAGYLSTELN